MTAAQQIVTVATAGTPVQLPDTPQGIRPYMMYIQAHQSNTADGYLGLSGLTKATGVAVIKRLDAAVGDFLLYTNEPKDNFSVREYWLDADANAQKFLVTYWTK